MAGNRGGRTFGGMLPTLDPYTAAIEEALQEQAGPADPEAGAETPEGQPQDEAPDGAPTLDTDPDSVADEADADGEATGEPGPDADVEVEEGDAGDEPDDDDGEGEPSAEIDPDAEYTLPDGQTVSGQELRDGFLRQRDYTRKTQEVADQRREVEELYQRMSSWYESRADDPAGWITEIASEFGESPEKAFADAIASSAAPTDTVAWVIRHLAEAGKLDPKFTEAFGLESLVEESASRREKDRISKLEQRIEEQDQARDTDAKTQRIVAEYQRQWDSIVEQNGLQLTPEQSLQARVELMTFARDNEIPNLAHAYAALQAQQGGTRGHAKQQPKPSDAEAKAAVEKKRATRAMTRTPSPAAGSKPIAPGDYGAVIEESMRELGMSTR